MKIVIDKVDRFRYEVRDKEYCDETFGEDYIQDYGVEVPESLVKEYQELEAKMREVQVALRAIYEENNKKI